MPIGRLHVLTDTQFQHRFSHAELAEKACAGGADVIQFRQKTGPLLDKLALLTEVAALCRATATQLIVNDYLDLALAVSADGVHLGQDDLPVSMVRTVVELHDGPTQLIGATCTTIDQVDEAVRAGADYIGFGPVFQTTSKANPASVKGLEGLAEVCNKSPIPVIAIGGMTVERVDAVLKAGAYGVAVMSAITMADDPERATSLIRGEMERVLSGSS